MISDAKHREHLERVGVATLDYIEHEIARAGWVGTVGIEICTTCGFTKAHCYHERNSWNADGTVLTCDLCGADGT